MNLCGVMVSFVPASDRHPFNICLKCNGSLSCYLISATNFSLNNAGLKTKMQVHGLIFFFPSIAVKLFSFSLFFSCHLFISVVLFSLFTCLPTSYHSFLKVLLNRVLRKAFGHQEGRS